MYCYDCKAKLHFAAAKSITRNQEHFRCSNYKSGRGECTVHYIRDIEFRPLSYYNEVQRKGLEEGGNQTV
ncbi:MAG: hypothetical protein NC548_44220 [Lachnospiraceae bacterium]|nr:hypothetical protein [Lachnospiraceae bacterium]